MKFSMRCVELNIQCYAPVLAVNEAVDFVIDKGGRLVTVQVKKASLTQVTGHSPRVSACIHGCAPRLYKTEDPDYRKRIDYFAFVCLELNCIWLIPEADVKVKQTWSVRPDQVSSLKDFLF